MSICAKVRIPRRFVLVLSILATAPGAARGEAPTARGAGALLAHFGKAYEPVEALAPARIPSYELPLDLSTVVNLAAVTEFLDLEAAEPLLAANGFVVRKSGGDDFADAYEAIEHAGLPVFVTADTLLHLYHVQFDELLKAVEEEVLHEDLWKLTNSMLERTLAAWKGARAGFEKDAARRVVAYFAVPHAILADTAYRVPEDLATWDAARLFAELESIAPDREIHDRIDPSFRERDEAFFETIREKLFAGEPLSTQEAKRLGEFLVELDRLYHEAAGQPREPARAVELPAEIESLVSAERALIEAHAGLATSSVMGYEEDYSQYVPRGHYTRSPTLRRYFAAMTWFGRMAFLAKGTTPDGALRGPVTIRQAQSLSASAAILVRELLTAKTDDSDAPELWELWERIYVVTSFFVGLADDFTPRDYLEILHAAEGDVSPAALEDEGAYYRFLLEVAKRQPPAIYAGTGGLAVIDPAILDGEPRPDLVDKALSFTAGLRFLGQRFVPDSYFLGTLVFPTVGRPTSDKRSFTRVESLAGPIRGFPRGLDVMNVLGSRAAAEILDETGDSAYLGYNEGVARLAREIAPLSREDWNRNLYWGWIHSLRALLASAPEGYPTAMRTSAWDARSVTLALASWSQLRHDTILYAKQSYTLRAEGAEMPAERVEGYVEPAIELYARLLALNRMTRRGLEGLGALPAASEERLRRVDQMLERLIAISTRELANEALADLDYEFIRSFAGSLEWAVKGDDIEVRTSLIADVHTDSNSGRVLEEGTGTLDRIAVVYLQPNGKLVCGVGPALSYHEFLEPMSDRLTDEAWRARLEGADLPPLPEWFGRFGR